MKWIGNRVSFKDHNDFFTMIITSKTEGWKMWLMFFWFLAWSASGLVIIYNLFFTDQLKESELYFYTFLFFWTYFWYKIIRVLIWRKYGIEFIRIDKDRFTIKKSIWGFGKAKEYLTENVNNFELEPLEEKSFSKVFNDSFWIIGQGSILLKISDNQYNFGAQISTENGHKIVKLLNARIKKYKSIG
mgnify:FL=1